MVGLREPLVLSLQKRFFVFRRFCSTTQRFAFCNSLHPRQRACLPRALACPPAPWLRCEQAALFKGDTLREREDFRLNARGSTFANMWRVLAALTALLALAGPSAAYKVRFSVRAHEAGRRPPTAAASTPRRVALANCRCPAPLETPQILAVPLPGADSHLFTVSRVTAELVARGHDVLLAVAESDVATLQRAAPNAGRVVVYPAAYSKQVREWGSAVRGCRGGGGGGAEAATAPRARKTRTRKFATRACPASDRLGPPRSLARHCTRARPCGRQRGNAVAAPRSPPKSRPSARLGADGPRKRPRPASKFLSRLGGRMSAPGAPLSPAIPP